MPLNVWNNLVFFLLLESRDYRKNFRTVKIGINRHTTANVWPGYSLLIILVNGGVLFKYSIPQKFTRDPFVRENVRFSFELKATNCVKETHCPGNTVWGMFLFSNQKKKNDVFISVRFSFSKMFVSFHSVQCWKIRVKNKSTFIFSHQLTADL